jgi:hypothetical protein
MTHGNRVTRNEETSRFGVAVRSGLQDTRPCIAGNVFERAAVLHVRYTAFDVGYQLQILHVTTLLSRTLFIQDCLMIVFGMVFRPSSIKI